jgi:single-strand selective monofunctional uracil DNA glycosylase
VLEACDEHLLAVLEALEPARAIGVGAWAKSRLDRAVAGAGLELATGSILHPSPASPAANKGWLEVVRRQLAELGCPWPEAKHDGCTIESHPLPPRDA